MHNAYLSGFVKGAGILVGVILLYFLASLFLPETNSQIRLQLIVWLSGVLLISYLRSKYKLAFGWAAAGIFFNWLLLPFLFGEIEKVKMQKNQNL